MRNLGLNQIREEFLSFFESKGHLRLKSASLVPQNDKSLLLINSGMAPLKPYFTGQEVPPSKRVATCQKCIRTGDIENVGKTARHGTFFEMLGNFSFGDYFKEEIIPWAWEFVTEVLELPKDRLYVSVYEEDDEAYEIWNKKINIPEDRIFRMGKEDNFWEVGLGPCGPCSEIYYDKGEQYGCKSPDCKVGCECDRYMEFWNLVFTQFNKEEDGTYSNLEHPNIDTGMGLERMATIMQDVNSIFDIDTIKAIRDKTCEISNYTYGTDSKKDISIRIITDHIRSITFMAADGVLPSNEKQGYVFRRLLRRAVRHGKLLGIDESFLDKICRVVIEVSKDAYPELMEKKEYIIKLLTVEEKNFFETLDQGMAIFRELIEETKKRATKTILGSEAFKLYDTYGFPLELMKEILEEELLYIDDESFNEEMNAQKERARAARNKSTFMGSEETIYSKLDANLSTKFIGYNSLICNDAKIHYIIKDDELVDKAESGNDISIILDKTVFYGESGGQKGDSGIIITPNGRIKVIDSLKITGNKIIHIAKVTEGFVKVSDVCTLEVDKDIRMNTARNHSATHLLHHALKMILGNHVEQAGSLVSMDRLRFDFTHFESMTDEQISEAEDIINKNILDSYDINVLETNINEAKKMGAMALFGEKYGETVRVVKMCDSVELCGGTHINNTSQIGIFKIISENGIAAGVRRIEAVTGRSAFLYYKELNNRVKNISNLLKVNPDNIIRRIEYFINETKTLNQQVEKLNSKMMNNSLEDIIKNSIEINGTSIITANLNNMDINALRKTGDQLKDKLSDAVIILSSSKDDKVVLLAMATDLAIKKGVHSGNLIKEVSKIIGGSGGGKANMAQAGGKLKDKINDALSKSKETAENMLK